MKAYMEVENSLQEKLMNVDSTKESEFDFN